MEVRTIAGIFGLLARKTNREKAASVKKSIAYHYRKNLAIIRKDAQWEESKHPRDDSGKFTSGSGSSGKRSDKTKRKLDRRAEATRQQRLGGSHVAIQTMLTGKSALDKIGWLKPAGESKPASEPKKPESTPLLDPNKGTTHDDNLKSYLERGLLRGARRGGPSETKLRELAANGTISYSHETGLWQSPRGTDRSALSLLKLHADYKPIKERLAELESDYNNITRKFPDKEFPAVKEKINRLRMEHDRLYGTTLAAPTRETQESSQTPAPELHKPKEFDRANEVVLTRTSSPDIFELRGDAKALGLEGVKIPMMVIDHSARGAKALRVEVRGASFPIKDDLKAAGFKWDPGVSVWYHPHIITGETIRRDIASTLKDMKPALSKKPNISLHLTRA